jgi:hypothetical protein
MADSLRREPDRCKRGFGFWSPSGLMTRLARLKVVLGSANWIASNSRRAFCSAGYYSRHRNGENI